MVEFIIIFERITFSIEWDIDINELYLPLEFLFEWVESEEIIAFYDEIIRYISVIIFSERFEIVPPILIDSLEFGEDFRVEESIYLVASESFIIEYLISFWVFLILSTCENTILICPYKRDFFSLIECFSIDIESDEVFVSCIAIREEVFAHHKRHKSLLVEYEASLYLSEKSLFCERITEEESDERGIECISKLLRFIFQDFPIFRDKASICLEYFEYCIEERGDRHSLWRYMIFSLL